MASESNEAYILDFGRNRGLALTSLFWVGAVLIAFLGGLLKSIPASAMLPYAGIAFLPAFGGFALWPFADREWAQVLVLLLWIAFAILACFAVSFTPMVILFLCAPLVATLFEREKVIEAIILSAFFAGVVFCIGKFGYAPRPLTEGLQTGWAQFSGVGITLTFLFSILYLAAGADLASIFDTHEEIAFDEAFPRAAFKFSAEGVLVSATDLALSLFGLSEKDYDFTTISSLDNEQNDTNLPEAFDRARETNERISGLILTSYTGENEEGTERHYALDLVPQDDGSVYIFATDCSQMAKKLDRLEMAQTNAQKQSAEKTLFFAGVSHELRTPLNAIIGFSDMMRSRLFGPLPGKYAEYASLIHDSGQHMLDLIGDVLDMSKVEAGKYELNYDKFDMADVVRSSLKMVRPSADAAELTLSVDIDVNHDLLIEADRRAVRQILLNLLSNAIKFTPKGGRVLVSAKIVQDVLNLSVEDNGTGMSKHDLEKIGTAYMQGSSAQMIDARGSGLGLSLVKNLVDLHNGRTVMNSHPGAGTSVNIYLPVHKQAQERPQNSTE
ncbi:MAG: hypothetical protein COA69_01710 [Robiginitomaculum sp.]|nr:MAG: hypothetical protein COA69_01710 [Robiginitomaculum sp.]